MSDIQKQRLKMNIARMKDMHKQRMQSMKDRLESMPDTKKEEKDLLGKYMPEAKRMNKKELERDTEQERDEKVERMRQQQSKIYEISKYSLARYQQKAADDLRDKGVDQGASIAMKAAGMKPSVDTDKNRKRMSNRVIGIGRAANKLTQKTNEDVDEGVLGALGGGIVGGLVGGPAGAALGAYAGHKMQQQKNKIKKLQKPKVATEDAALKKVAAELEGASKKHLKQAQKVKAHVDKMEEENIEEKAMGLYYNINKKRKEGRPMRKKGAKGAPKVSDFARAKQTASEENTETIEQTYARKVARELLDMTESGLMEDGHQDVASARRKAVLIMEDAAQLLMKLKNMDPMDSLPSWWMNKMSVTAAYMDSMRNYLLVPSEMPSDNMPTESYSMVSSDTNPGMKKRKNTIMVPASTPVSEKKEKKKKPKLIPTGPFVSFGTGSYTDSGNGASEAVDFKLMRRPMGRIGVPKVRAKGGLPKNMFKTKDAFKDPKSVKEDDQEKMKNIDNMMKMYKNRKPLKDLVGQQRPGMKTVKANMDAIPSTDKAGRVSRSRMQKKFGRNINFD